MIVDARRNLCVLGPRYEATLEDIEHWLQDEEGAQ